MNTFDFTEINNLINKYKNYLEEGQVRIVTINGCQLMVYENGNIYRNYRNCGDWRFIPNNENNNDGYNRICCNNKVIFRHRIIAHAFLGLDISNTKSLIDHIDGNRINNHFKNLRVVNNQQNTWNRTKAKGYYYYKKLNKYHAQIKIDNRRIHLGYFQTEEEARAAYKAAKLIYHVIN